MNTLCISGLELGVNYEERKESEDVNLDTNCKRVYFNFAQLFCVQLQERSISLHITYSRTDKCTHLMRIFI